MPNLDPGIVVDDVGVLEFPLKSKSVESLAEQWVRYELSMKPYFWDWLFDFRTGALRGTVFAVGDVP